MKHLKAIISLALLLGLIYYSFYSLMPQRGVDANAPKTEFSSERALVPLNVIAKKPHYIGSEAHQEVQEYLVQQLKNLGFQTHVHEGFVLNPGKGSFDKPENILGRIEGSGDGKALLLLSHYDSALVPSFGASDAGSGVVTILESLRAYLESGEQPANDIIVLFSDAEEVGLDGAELFVNDHPWALDVGIVLNFEARGSGGPSNMILETNGGNANLIKAFIEANPKYPVASSLMYSIYKMLPNDTDSTVFREDGDIDSFFFAFIDDHFDYHTANDNIENLDVNTLQHQGTYLLPLINYFASSDLSQLKAEEDYVYTNFPFVKMISYPFAWILPMLILAVILFIGLIFYGIKRHNLHWKGIGKGFSAFLLSLITSGVIGYFGWIIIEKLYPHYEEIQHGFKYNGHYYVAFFVLLSIAITLKMYRRFGKGEKVANLAIAPLFLWMLVNTAVFIIIKGAGYFIIPVFFGLISLWILMRQEKPSLILMTLLGAPAIFIFSPLIQFFPVGLGSDHVFISCVFTVLLLGLLVPVFGFYKLKNTLAIVCLLGTVGYFIAAHATSDFSETRQKPNSLVYYLDADEGNSYWATYDKTLDDWTKGYLGESPETASNYVKSVSGSKYNTSYSFASEAPMKEFPMFEAVVKEDSINDVYRNVRFVIKPQRDVNQLSLYADKDIVFRSISYNGKSVPADSLGNAYSTRTGNRLLRYYVSKNDSLEVAYSVKKETPVSFIVMEYSYDLLENDLFTISERPKDMMPKPFVVTDAIIIKKTIDIETLPRVVKDSIIAPLNE